MELVRQFCFAHGLLGDKTNSPDDVAISFPDGTILGKPDRVRLRFEQPICNWRRKGSCEHPSDSRAALARPRSGLFPGSCSRPGW